MVQVVDRIGALLATFTRDHATRSLTEIADEAGLNKSSAYRLLVSLEAIGLTERRGTSWRLGPQLVHLANVRLGQMALRRAAAARLPPLCETFRASGALSIPDEHDMVYLDRYDSPEPFAARARLGARWPLWAGASGQAVLSRLAPEARAVRLESPEWAAQDDERRSAVLAELEAAAQRGYAIDRGDFIDGVAGVAAPVCDVDGRPAAAVALIVAPSRIAAGEDARMGAALRALADELVPEVADVVGLTR